MEHCRNLENQYLNERTANIYFIIENNERIPAHKSILAANSLMLDSYFNENIDVKTIEIQDASSSAFKEFLFAFYSKHPEKKFTIKSATMLLQLAKMFKFAFCAHKYERFLIDNLNISSFCFGYGVAQSFDLTELEMHCMKQINMNKRQGFETYGFLDCDLIILQKILSNLIINQREEFEMVRNACQNWVEEQCVKMTIDSSDKENRRNLLDNCLNSLNYISLIGDSLTNNDDSMYFDATEHIEDAIDTKDVNDVESTTVASSYTVSKPVKKDTFAFERFRETMLATQFCSANETISIELRTTKEMKLSGIGFATVIGVPRGEIIIRSDDDESYWIEEPIRIKSKYQEPKNVCAFSNDVNLVPNQNYTINVKLSKDVVFYQSRKIFDMYSINNDVDVMLKKCSGRDILSHLFFTI